MPLFTQQHPAVDAVPAVLQAPGETMMEALVRGLDLARLKAPSATRSITTSKPERLPRAGSNQAKR